MGAGIDVLPAPLQSCAANQRKKLEHLCRYITRPAIANERLALNRAGQVVLTLTEDTLSRWHDLYRDVAAGIHTTTRRAGSPSAVGSHSLPWWVRTQSQIATSSTVPVRWHLDDHRRHRTSPRHCEDPRPPRLARPGTAPIARAGIRPIPNGLLIPGPRPPPTRSDSRADSLLWPALAREAKTPPDPRGSGPLGPRKGPEHPGSWTRRIVSLTTHRSIGTLPLVEKGPLKFLYLCQTSSSSIFKAGGSAASLSTVFLKG